MGMGVKSSDTMKIFCLFLLLGVASGEDWTCDECVEGGAALGAFASSESAVHNQVDVLLADVCPQAQDADLCLQDLPAFWAQLSPIIFPTHFSHICDDLAQCPPPAKASVPDCEACQGRVNGVTDALAWEETITTWVTGLQYDGFCGSFHPDEDRCKEAVAFLIPLAFPALVQQPRDWVVTFCGDVWGCQA